LYEKGVGTSIPQLTIPMIVDKQIPLPQLNEQKNIVNLIKSQFNAVEKLKYLISEQSKYINALPSSILRKAFNGEY
jgi:type I restriction enzyme S subunit